MNIEDLLRALFGGGPPQQQQMSPEDQAMASAVLARRTGPGTIEEGGGRDALASAVLARPSGPDSIEEVRESGPDDESAENAVSSSPLRRRSARQNVDAAFGDFVDSVDDGRSMVIGPNGEARSEPARGRREGQGGRVDVADIYRRRNRLKAGDDGGDIKL